MKRVKRFLKLCKKDYLKLFKKIELWNMSKLKK